MSDLERLTKTIIQAQLTEALKGNDEYIEALVQAVFQREVNEHGGKPDAWSKDKIPWLEYCARNAIQNATRSAVLEFVKEIEPKIAESVRKSLTEDDIVSAFTKKVMSTMGEDFRISVTVSQGDD